MAKASRDLHTAHAALALNRTPPNPRTYTVVCPPVRKGVARIGLVYAIRQRCGHARQHTLLLPVSRNGQRALERAITVAQLQTCDVCVEEFG